MPDHKPERELLIESLPPKPDSPRWAEIEERVLGRGDGCYPTLTLMELSRGLITDDKRRREIEEHVRGCDYCGSWYRGYSRPADSPPMAETLRILAESAAAAPVREAAAAGEPAGRAAPVGSPRAHSVLAHLVAGRTREAVEALRPCFPDLLAAVGLNPDLRERFWQFVLRQLDKGSHFPPSGLIGWFEQFAREDLGREGIPYRPRPEDWESGLAAHFPGPKGRRRARRRLAVAVVSDRELGFLVSFDEKQGGYTFPMRERLLTESEGEAACNVLREALRREFKHAEAEPLLYVEHRDPAGPGGRGPLTSYQLFKVEPNVPNERLQPTPFGHRSGFLRYQALVAADLVTLSTKAIAEKLMDHRPVAAAVIARRVPSGCEILMVRTRGRGAHFLPVSRIKTGAPPAEEAREAVRHDIGYRGTIITGAPRVVRFRQPSPRFEGGEQGFVFHVVPVRLPEVDLSTFLSQLIEDPRKPAVVPRWVPEDQLADPEAHGLSPTLVHVREAVLQSCAELQPA